MIARKDIMPLLNERGKGETCLMIAVKLYAQARKISITEAVANIDDAFYIHDLEDVERLHQSRESL